MNPTVRQLEILRHSLGLDMHGRGRMYREHYCIPINFESDDLTAIREMASDGLMEEAHKINEGRDQYFIVTELGKAAATHGVKPEKLTRAQRRYREWLNLDTGITFHQYLTSPRFKESRERA